jgi:hypothetical protein
MTNSPASNHLRMDFMLVSVQAAVDGAGEAVDLVASAGLGLGALASGKEAGAAAGVTVVGAALASVLATVLASVPTPELAPSLAFPASPPRKSVTYQPEPLS